MSILKYILTDDMSDVEKMRRLIQYIANDYVELSHDKVVLQRNEYIRMCHELLERMENNNDTNDKG